MVSCDICGKQLELPFRCNYCGSYFCGEHRLPESHNCKKEPFSGNRQRKIGTCPKCHKENSREVRYYPKKSILKCFNCGLVYGQRKSYPYPYFRVRRRKRITRPYTEQASLKLQCKEVRPTTTISSKKSKKHNKKALAVILIAVILISSVALLASIVKPNLSSTDLTNTILSSSTPNPTTSPTSPIAFTGRVVGVVGGSVIGENISGVEISVIDSRGNVVMTNKTDAEGCFSFSNLLDDSYNIQITVPYGYVAKSATSYSVSYSSDFEFKIQNLLVNPKTMHYHYTLRGVSSEIAFTVYEGMYDYLVSSEDSSVTSYVGQQPSPEEITRIVTLRYINESVEKGELHNLVSAIQQITPNEDDQVRIAISLVQNIPYDWNAFTTNNVQWKYPYEVLYSNTGVCGQKSLLLVCILRELGYGCSILEFSNHAAVGIACPSQYAYYSGYAFVESTTPSIITDCYGDYVGAGKLPSSPSYVIVIQDGKVMNSVSEEYQDAQTFLSLNNMGQVLDEYHYTQWQALVSKYGIQVS